GLEAGAAPLGDHVAGLGVVVDHVPAAGGVGERVLARAADDADADVGGALALDVEEVAAVEAVEADLPGLGGVERAAVELLVPVPLVVGVVDDDLGGAALAARHLEQLAAVRADDVDDGGAEVVAAAGHPLEPVAAARVGLQPPGAVYLLD